MGKKTLIKNLPDLNKARVRNASFNIEYDSFTPSSFLVSKLSGKNYFIRTYGCQANVRDEETMSGMLDLVGMNKVDEAKDADVIIINTCAVRENAEDKVFGEIGNLKRLKETKNPLIMVCGCMVLQNHIVEKILNIYKQVDVIFGTHNINSLLDLIEEVLRKDVHLVDVPSSSGNVHEIKEARRLDSYKAFINIMYGCNKFCTYCIVPYTRGMERSRRKEDILEEAKCLIAQGYKEITLLGQNVNSYGKDLYSDYTFANLLEDVALLGVPRLRFTTSHPYDFTDEMIEIIAKHDNIMKFIHLPVQSGNDKILHSMNRRYNREQYLNLVKRMKEKIPNLALSTDIIVGFPNETYEEFKDTVTLCQEVGYDSAFTFIYSPRKGTPASKIQDNVEYKEKSRRFIELTKALEVIIEEKSKKMVGEVFDVLVDSVSKKDKTMLSGYNENNKLINFKGDESYIGKIIKVKIIESHTYSLIGEIINDD